MAKYNTNPKVDTYFNGGTKWKEELEVLRHILLNCGLTEDIKWGKPCYMFENHNVIILYELKESCAIGFMKGSLLKDPEKILLMPGENSQAGRWIRFTNVKDILRLEPVIKSYIFEAIEVEKAGLKIAFRDVSDYVIPEELKARFNSRPELKKAFESLTPGRQKGYLLHFSQPKQIKTREDRIDKNTERILKGKGLNDCICGLSKSYPRCDGSHKNIC